MIGHPDLDHPKASGGFVLPLPEPTLMATYVWPPWVDRMIDALIDVGALSVAANAFPWQEREVCFWGLIGDTPKEKPWW